MPSKFADLGTFEFPATASINIACGPDLSLRARMIRLRVCCHVYSVLANMQQYTMYVMSTSVSQTLDWLSSSFEEVFGVEGPETCVRHK